MTSRSMISVPVLAGWAVAFALGLSAAPSFAQVPANLTAALADPARPAADTARDAARHPAELLALANIKPGGKVADFIIGGGYFTRILSAAVGPTGTVYAYQPAEFVKFQAKYGEDLKTVAAAYKNVTPLDGSLTGLDLPDGLDAVITVQNYHDLHLKPFPVDTAAKITSDGLLGSNYVALEPGGDEKMIADGGQITATQDPVNIVDLVGRFIFGGPSGGKPSGQQQPQPQSAPQTNPAAPSNTPTTSP